MNVIIQPCAGPLAQKNLRNTIYNKRGLDILEDFLTKEEVDILKKSNKTNFEVWGCKINNKKHFDKFYPGDIVVFTAFWKLFASAEIVLTTTNKDLAKKLWNQDYDFDTWDYIFIMKDLKPLDIDSREINKIVGYLPTKRMHRLMLLEDELAFEVRKLINR